MSISTGSERAGRLHPAQYQRWEGRRSSGRGAWLAMVWHGVRQRLHGQFNHLLLMASLSLPLTACAIFFALSLLEELAGTPRAQGAYDFFRTLFGVDLSALAKISAYRPVLWKMIFLFMVKLELFYVLVLVGRIGPGLVADDLRAAALPIYFARPITPASYLFSKWCIVAIFIGAGTLAPNLLALAGGFLLTGGLPTVGQTLALAGALTLISLIAMIVGGLLILLISSLTRDVRYALVAWLALFLLPAGAQALVNSQLTPAETAGFIGTLSLRDDFLLVAEKILDLRAAWAATPLPPEAWQAGLNRPVPVTYPLIVLSLVTIISGVIVYRRIVRFSQRTNTL